MYKNKKLLEQVRDGLMNGLAWADTVEGSEYWCEFYNKVCDLIEEKHEYDFYNAFYFGIKAIIIWENDRDLQYFIGGQDNMIYCYNNNCPFISEYNFRDRPKDT